jgi:hypothetical protein
MRLAWTLYGSYGFSASGASMFLVVDTFCVSLALTREEVDYQLRGKSTHKTKRGKTLSTNTGVSLITRAMIICFLSHYALTATNTNYVPSKTTWPFHECLDHQLSSDIFIAKEILE